MANNDRLHVGFDAKRAFNNMTGLGNYSRLVIAGMAALYPDARYSLFTPRRRSNPRIDPILMRDNVDVITPSGFHARVPSLWRSLAMGTDVADARCDIFHGLSNEIPLGPMPCPTIVTIHDLIWRRCPQDYKPVDRLLYDFKYRRSALRATRIIAISERTRDDIVSDWHIDPARIDVIYQGCDPAFSRPVDYEARRSVRERYNLPRRFIISVGTVQPRKNQMLSLRALQAVDPDVALVFVGRADSPYAADIAREASRLRLDNRVIWLSNVPFDDLPPLYAAAELSAYTSRYEGFGIPVIEALSCGTPVVACSGSCLEEAGGPGAVYVAPDDVTATAGAFNALLNKPYMRDRLVDAGRRYIRRFNHSAFASAIMATYNKALLDHALSPLK